MTRNYIRYDNENRKRVACPPWRLSGLEKRHSLQHRFGKHWSARPKHLETPAGSVQNCGLENTTSASGTLEKHTGYWAFSCRRPVKAQCLVLRAEERERPIFRPKSIKIRPNIDKSPDERSFSNFANSLRRRRGRIQLLPIMRQHAHRQLLIFMFRFE